MNSLHAEKVFVILGLKLSAGRLWPAAAVTPAPGQAPQARVSAGRGSSRLASVVTATRCEPEPNCARNIRNVGAPAGRSPDDRGGQWKRRAALVWRPAVYGVSLLVAEGLDLGELGLAQLARDLALGDLGALHLLPDLLHDLGVGERGDDAAHDLAGPGLRHVGDDPDVPRAGDLADVGLDRVLDLRLDLRCGGEAGLERDVHLDHAAADVVDDRDRRRLRDLLHGQRRRLQLLGAEPVAGYVDDVVDAAEDPEVAVCTLGCAVAGEVRPVAPVLAVR